MPLDPNEVQAETVRYLVAKNQELAAEVARLQVLADARLYRARAARITLESVGIPRSEPVDVGAARAAGMIEDLRAEVARLTAALAAAQAARDALRERAEHAEALLTGLLPGPVSDALVDARNHQSRTEGVSAAADWGRTVGRVQVLAAAQAAPVVEWRTRIDVEEATVGAFALLVESDGWRLEVSDGTGDYWIVDSGDETGPAGKSAAEAAYRRACGFPTAPPCAG